MVTVATGLVMAGGCSTPPKPRPDRELQRVMMESATQMMFEVLDRQAARAETGAIRLPPALLQLLTRIVAHRQSTGEWPRSEHFALPEGVTGLQLTPEETSLRIQISGACPVAAKLLPEGTLLLYPPVARAPGSGIESPPAPSGS